MDSNSETEAEIMEKKSRLGPCEVCAIEEAKYSCPKCEVKTCCLKCINIHKKELDCNGIRDKTKFVPLRQMTESEFYCDYRFLEECTRYRDDRQRDKLKRHTRFNKNLPKHLFKLRAAAYERKIHLKFLLQIFTKRNLNTTFYDWKENVIYWRIEWIFLHANNNGKFVDERCNENGKLMELLEKYFCVENSNAKCLEYYQSKGIGSVLVLLKAEGIKRCKNRFFELDLNKTLKENLEGKTLVEYPMVYVLYRENENEFDVIDSDEDVYNEAKEYEKELDENYKNKINSTEDSSTNRTINSEEIQKKDEMEKIAELKREKRLKREQRQNQPKNFLFTNDNDSDDLSSSTGGDETEEESSPSKKVKL